MEIINNQRRMNTPLNICQKELSFSDLLTISDIENTELCKKKSFETKITEHEKPIGTQISNTKTNLNDVLIPPPSNFSPPTPTPTPIPKPNNSIEKESINTIRILIIGYYYHKNIGDDQYIDVFKYIFQKTTNIKYKLKFIDCDKLQLIDIKPTDIVILGGGDVLNHYFLDKIIDVFKDKKNLIMAVSVGIPYLDILVNTNKLNIIDYLFIRTKQEYDTLNEFYHKERIFYLPDISFFMKNISILNDLRPKLQRFSFGNRNVKNPYTNSLNMSSISFSMNNLSSILSYFKIKQRRKIIGISLNRHIYSKNTSKSYRTIVKTLASVIYWLLSKEYVICFLPFNVYTLPQDVNCETKYSNFSTIPLLEEYENNQENDILLHNDVLHEIKNLNKDTNNDHYINNIINIQQRLYPKEVFEVTSYFDFAITMRFHSTLFSIYNNVPFLPIFTTKKIRNLLLDIEYPPILKYELEVDSNDIPIKIDEKILCSKLSYLLEGVVVSDNKLSTFEIKKVHKKIQEDLRKTCFYLQSDLSKSIPILLKLISQHTNTPSLLLGKETMNSNIDIDSCKFQNKSKDREEIEVTCQESKNNSLLIKVLESKLYEYCGENDFRSIENPHIQKNIISIISFYLTGGDIHSVYCDGLSEKMFYSKIKDKEIDYIKEWNWVIKDHIIHGGRSPKLLLDSNISNINEENGNITTQLLQIPTKSQQKPAELNTNKISFNIHYFNQEDKSGVHRSGWNYVYNELKKYHNDEPNTPLLDMYIDRTFHWEREILKTLDIIPYRKKWCGFIHHTFDTTFSEYNNVNLLQNTDFLESLKHCKCIFVLSKTLEIQLKIKMTEIGWKNVPIVYLTHPTEIEGITNFSYSNFLENNQKRLLHIGGWLRNTLTFYQLHIPRLIQLVSNKSTYRNFEKTGLKSKITDSLKKTVLMNINNGNYHPTERLQDSIYNVLRISEIHRNNHLYNTCGGSHRMTNNWNIHFFNFFQDLMTSVEKINKLSNEDYDELLSKNIVFLHLVDASAINTVIECCVRNCPFFINRHPAVVEIVGNDYPLFYDISESTTNSTTTTFFEINKQIEMKLKNPSSIHKTYKYLTSLDKSRFHINNFITNLHQQIVSI